MLSQGLGLGLARGGAKSGGRINHLEGGPLIEQRRVKTNESGQRAITCPDAPSVR